VGNRVATLPRRRAFAVHLADAILIGHGHRHGRDWQVRLGGTAVIRRGTRQSPDVRHALCPSTTKGNDALFHHD
jgi:hypothetical protein